MCLSAVICEETCCSGHVHGSIINIGKCLLGKKINIWPEILKIIIKNTCKHLFCRCWTWYGCRGEILNIDFNCMWPWRWNAVSWLKAERWQLNAQVVKCQWLMSLASSTRLHPSSVTLQESDDQTASQACNSGLD